VSVSRPPDVLAARVAVAGSSTTLFLGLGGVALLVGAIGIANLMVISVLERRTEIGLRGRSARPDATSLRSSSPNRCCSERSAGSQAFSGSPPR
jgi:hypothetical protein